MQKDIFRVILWMGFVFITTIILQNTISRFNLFRMENFDAYLCYILNVLKAS